MGPTPPPNRNSRIITPGRAVAILVIGVVILALAYVRFGGDDEVSVPAGRPVVLEELGHTLAQPAGRAAGAGLRTRPRPSTSTASPGAQAAMS